MSGTSWEWWLDPLQPSQSSASSHAAIAAEDHGQPLPRSTYHQPAAIAAPIAPGCVKDNHPKHKKDLVQTDWHPQEDDVAQSKPQPRLSIVGSNWGTARAQKGRRRVEKATTDLLRLPAHIQCVLELCTQSMADDLGKQGLSMYQQEDGGPALVWLRSNFDVSHQAHQTFLSESGHYGGQAVTARFTPRRPGFQSLQIAAAHLSHEEAKKREVAAHIVNQFRSWIENVEAHITFVDGNQHSHARWEDKSMLQRYFDEDHDFLQPAEGAPLFSRSPESIMEGGACTGFLIRRALLQEATLWQHGTYDAPPHWQEFFRAEDVGWHRAMYVQLASIRIPQGYRVRSEAALERRQQKRREKAKTNESPSKWSSWSWSHRWDRNQWYGRQWQSWDWSEWSQEAAIAAGSQSQSSTTAIAVQTHNASDSEEELRPHRVPAPTLSEDESSSTAVAKSPLEDDKGEPQSSFSWEETQQSADVRPLAAVIARIKAIYMAQQSTHDVESKIRKYQQKYGEHGVHALCLALEAKYARQSDAVKEERRASAKMYIRIGEAKTPGPEGSSTTIRRRIRGRSTPARATPREVVLGRGPGETSSIQIAYVEEADPSNISLTHINKRNKFRWQSKCLDKLGRLTGADRSTPKEALADWFRLHQHHLQEDFRAHIQNLLQSGHGPSSRPSTDSSLPRAQTAIADNIGLNQTSSAGSGDSNGTAIAVSEQGDTRDASRLSPVASRLSSVPSLSQSQAQAAIAADLRLNDDGTPTALDIQSTLRDSLTTQAATEAARGPTAPTYDTSKTLSASDEQSPCQTLISQVAIAIARPANSNTTLHDSAPERPLDAIQIANILQARMLTRRHPPLSCNSNWKAINLRVVTATDCHEGLMLILPKLLLSTPSQMKNPRQQEHHIAHNIRLAEENAWQTLYSRCLLHAQTALEGHQPRSTTEGEDHLSISEAKRLMRLAKDGQHSKAWKQLHSPGLAPATAQTFEAALQKLQPRGDAPVQCPEPPHQCSIPRQIWHKAIRGLRLKKAADPGGWSTELWQTLWQDELLQPSLQRWLEAITAPQASSACKKLISITHLVMLAKPSGSGVRPILLVSLFRKILHSAIAHLAGPELHQLTDHAQFGHQAQGALLLLAAAEGRRQRKPGHVLVQVDISSAFGNLSRRKLLQLLDTKLSPQARDTWLPYVRHSLSSGTEIVCPHDTHTTVTTYDGIPQGDPLSALLFSSALTMIMEEWAAIAVLQNSSNHVHDQGQSGPFYASYVDDTILGCERAQLTPLLTSLKTHLHNYGLELQKDKTKIWGSPILRSHPDTPMHLQAAGLTLDALTHGLTICGHAFGDEDDLEIPLGDDHYVSQWLAHKTTSLNKKLRRLQSLVLLDAPELPLVQVAMLLLRSMWPSSINHLLRALPAPLSRSWTESLQVIYDEALSNLGQLPALDANQKLLRSLPLSRGGLGLPDLGDLALAARLAALATIPNHPKAQLYKDRCIQQEAEQLTQRIETITGAPTQPIIGSVHQLPEGRSHKGLQHKLCDLFFIAYAKALRTSLSDFHPLMQAWRLHSTTDVPGAPPAHAGQASWLQAPPLPHLQLHDREMRLGLRRRLGLPLFHNHCRCNHLLTGGRPCNVPLDVHGNHALSCCHAIRTHRHNAIRDHICKYGKQCGLIGQVEQIAPIPTDRPQDPLPLSRADAQQETHDQNMLSPDLDDDNAHARPQPIRRADIHFSSATTPSVWIDVRVTHCPSPSQMTSHLRNQERLKRHSYGQGREVPTGIFAGLRPFVIDTRGRAAIAAQEMAAWMIQRRIRELQKSRCMAYSAAISVATNEFWQPIAIILQRSWGRALAYQQHALITSRG